MILHKYIGVLFCTHLSRRYPRFRTIPRFPATNQARNCYTRYNEYYKCIADKDEDSPDCKFYQKAYRSICPSEWVRMRQGLNSRRDGPMKTSR